MVIHSEPVDTLMYVHYLLGLLIFLFVNFLMKCVLKKDSNNRNIVKYCYNLK